MALCWALTRSLSTLMEATTHDGSVFEGDWIRGNFAQADPDGGEHASRVLSGKGGLVSTR